MRKMLLVIVGAISVALVCHAAERVKRTGKKPTSTKQVVPQLEKDLRAARARIKSLREELEDYKRKLIEERKQGNRLSQENDLLKARVATLEKRVKELEGTKTGEEE